MFKKGLFLFILFMIFTHASLAVTNSHQELQVLILHGYTADNLWTADQHRGFVEALSARHDVAFDTFYLDAKKHNQAAYFDEVKDFLESKHQGVTYDLVYVTDDYAHDFIRNWELSMVTERTPVVYSGVNYPIDIKGDKITGVYEKLDHQGLFAMIDLLYQDRKPVLLVGDQSLTNENIRRGVEELMESHSFDLDVEFLLTNDMARIEKEVAELKDAVIVMLVFNWDDQGREYSYQESFSRVYDHAQVPIFSYWDMYLSMGATGGTMLSGVDTGREAARLASEVVLGADPDAFAIEGVEAERFLDYAEVNRFGIDPSVLEEGSFRWHDRPESFIESNWEILLASLIVILVLLLIIFELMANIKKRREFAAVITEQKERLDALNNQLEEKVKRRTAQLEASLKETKRMQDEVIQAEKLASLAHLVAGISHEINTPLGLGVTLASFLDQSLTQLQKTYAQQEMTKSDLERYFDDAKQSLTQLLQNLDKAADLIHSFKNVSVDRVSEKRRTIDLKEYLGDIITTLTPEYKRKKIQFEITGDQASLSTYPGIFSQIFTNLILNALRHGFEEKSEGHIKIYVRDERDRVEIRFSDDGKGIDDGHKGKIFDPFFTTKLGKGGSGLGLNIVYNAVVNKLGGKIHLDDDDRWTTFVLHLPKEEAQHA